MESKCGIAKKVLRSNRGMALVLTIACISFLVVLTLQIISSVDKEWAGAKASAEAVRIDALLLSGLHLAQAALYQDQLNNTFDSLQDVWAHFDKDALNKLADGADLSIVVEDLSGRLQVNALGQNKRQAGAGETAGGQRVITTAEQKRYRALWKRFLSSGRFAIDEGDVDALLDSLADWVDKDNNERPLGAENGYYQRQDPPYTARNAPTLYPEELLLVRGMTRALLFGDAEHEGILAYITITGDDGRLNLNTAPLPVLQALAPAMDETAAQALADFRQSERNRDALEKTDWVQKVPGLPANFTSYLPDLTVSSNFFSVQIQVKQGIYRGQARAFLVREKNREQTLLLWKVN